MHEARGLVVVFGTREEAFVKQLDRPKVHIVQDDPATGLISCLLLLEFFRETMGGMATSSVIDWAALGLLSATALVSAVKRRVRKLGIGAGGEAARDTAGRESGGADPTQGLRQQGEPQRSRLSRSSRRLWTRKDGFTMSGTRTT